MIDPVARPELERALSRLVWPDDPRVGLFGPGSAAWRVFRERALVAYAPRAVMLQYAHPAFAAASASYASTSASPGERFDRAVRALLKMIFADRRSVLVSARLLHVMHDRLSGVLPEGSPALPAGSPYHGNDRASLAWILVTLLDASILAFERFVSPIDRALEQALFADVTRFAALFGLGEDDVPGSRRALDAFVEDHVLRVLFVGEEARAMWRFLGAPARRREILPRALLSGWAAFTLPPALRASLGAPLSPRRERAIDRLSRALSARALPDRLRFVDAYVNAASGAAART
jgi:uncharacterized protein (DUF2236 family)